MTLAIYRAVYQYAPPVSKLRGMTLVAPTPEEARRIAEDWQINDRLLTVKFIRHLQPQLDLR